MMDFTRSFTFPLCQGGGRGCRRPRYSPMIERSVKRSRPTTPNGWSNTSADKRIDGRASAAICQRCCSRQAVRQDVFQVQSVAEQRLADVFDAIGTQDIEGDGAQAGKIQRADADPTGVLIEGYVTDVMMRLDFPMPPDGGAKIDGAQAFLAEVDGAVGARRPHPIRRIFVPGQAGDTGRGDDQFIPVGTETTSDIKGLDPAPLLTAVSNLVLDLAPIDGRAMVRELFEGVKKGRLVAFDLSKDIAIALRSGAEGLLLAIHRITGIDHAGEAELADQGRHARNFVGLAVNLKMGEDDLLGDRERAQCMHRLPIVDMVEASPERLAIQCDERQSFLGGAVAHEMLRIAARGRLKRLATDRMQEQAHRVDRWRTLELAAEHPIENLPTLAHENDNMGETLRTRQNRQDTEQKKIRQREAPPLGTARIGNCTQSINQTGIGDHGILTRCNCSFQGTAFALRIDTLMRLNCRSGAIPGSMDWR